MESLVMTDEEKEKILLEERYATIRVKVRDTYDKCRITQRAIEFNKLSIEHYKARIHFYNKKRLTKKIAELQEEIDFLTEGLLGLEDFLKPLADELTEIESKFDDIQRSKYGCGSDLNWWIRR